MLGFVCICLFRELIEKGCFLPNLLTLPMRIKNGNTLISKRQFNRIRRLLPVHKHKNLLDGRLVLSGIIYVIRNGLARRQLPEFFGNWSFVYSKFRRWSKRRVIKNVFVTLAGMLPKRCTAMIDSTYVKAQRTATCMRSDGLPRELGRSRGGITTKIHLLCNDQQKPIDFILSAGQVSDIKIAPQLVAGNKMKKLLADKAYDSDRFRNLLASRQITVCSPAKSNRKSPIPHDARLYGKRHKIENMFARLKDWKGIAFRSNKCAHTFHSYDALALTYLFL